MLYHILQTSGIRTKKRDKEEEVYRETDNFHFLKTKNIYENKNLIGKLEDEH